MQTAEYEKDVLRTAPLDGKDLDEDRITYALLGLCGEAGEAAEVWKKVQYQGHPFDEATKQHLISEVGDVLFYTTLSAMSLGCSLEELMQVNMEKRQKRFPNGFEPERSIHRDPNDI